MRTPLRSTLARQLVAAACASLSQAEAPTSLATAFADHFAVGVALSTNALMRPEPEALDLVTRQYNAASPENLLKWEVVHPQPDVYDFAPADRFVEFGEKHGFSLLGHTLVWHSQTPDWVFQDATGQPLGREALLGRMKQHIDAVVGRYRGRIDAWDVVNEALDDDGTLRDSPWRRIIGDDYLSYAFRYAAAADPDARLYYNDYNLHLAAKRQGVVSLAARLKAAGCRIDGIGMQGHFGMDTPTEAEVDASIQAFAEAAGKVMISEMDINVLPWPDNLAGGADVASRGVQSRELDPYVAGLPADKQRELAERYAALFRIFVRRHNVIDRVTFWGIDDGRSWHNGWPIPGRTAHSLLFDRSLQPKPAYDAVIATVRPTVSAE